MEASGKSACPGLGWGEWCAGLLEETKYELILKALSWSMVLQS